MDIKVLRAMAFLELPERKIPFHTQNIQKLAEEILKSNSIQDINKMQQAILTLHSFRKRYPAQEKVVNTCLFDLQKKSLAAKNPYIIQGLNVPFLVGFEKSPVNDAEDAKKLIYAISQLPNIQYSMPMVERVTENITINYEKKFKSQDSDMSLARILRDFTAYCYWQKKKSGKKTVLDDRWAYRITNTLARIYPVSEFQNMAKQFPDKAMRSTANTTKMPVEEAVTYKFLPPKYAIHRA